MDKYGVQFPCSFWLKTLSELLCAYIKSVVNTFPEHHRSLHLPKSHFKQDGNYASHSSVIAEHDLAIFFEFSAPLLVKEI